MGDFSEEAMLGFITEMVATDFPGAVELRTQLPGIRMSAPTDGDGSRYLYPTQGQPARVRHMIPVEAEYTDRRGNVVNALLFVDGNGVLAELELYTVGVNSNDNLVASLPEPHAATIYAGPRPPDVITKGSGGRSPAD
jgi:hypothetical protein